MLHTYARVSVGLTAVVSVVVLQHSSLLAQDVVHLCQAEIRHRIRSDYGPAARVKYRGSATRSQQYNGREGVSGAATTRVSGQSGRISYQCVVFAPARQVESARYQLTSGSLPPAASNPTEVDPRARLACQNLAIRAGYSSTQVLSDGSSGVGSRREHAGDLAWAGVRRRVHLHRPGRNRGTHVAAPGRHRWRGYVRAVRPRARGLRAGSPTPDVRDPGLRPGESDFGRSPAPTRPAAGKQPVLPRALRLPQRRRSGAARSRHAGRPGQPVRGLRPRARRLRAGGPAPRRQNPGVRPGKGYDGGVVCPPSNEGATGTPRRFATTSARTVGRCSLSARWTARATRPRSSAAHARPAEQEARRQTYRGRLGSGPAKAMTGGVRHQLALKRGSNRYSKAHCDYLSADGRALLAPGTPDGESNMSELFNRARQACEQEALRQTYETRVRPGKGYSGWCPAPALPQTGEQSILEGALRLPQRRQSGPLAPGTPDPPPARPR